MNKYHEITKMWAANQQMPLTSDEQILLMKTAKERHEQYRARLKDLMNELDSDDCRD